MKQSDAASLWGSFASAHICRENTCGAGGKPTKPPIRTPKSGPVDKGITLVTMTPGPRVLIGTANKT